jgi:hypothetical protein
MVVIDVFGIMMFIGIIFIIGIAVVALDELLKWITRKTGMLIFKIKNYHTPYLVRITNELSLKDEIEFNNNLIKKLKKAKD